MRIAIGKDAPAISECRAWLLCAGENKTANQITGQKGLRLYEDGEIASMRGWPASVSGLI
jgi:hypothetical protein